MYQYPDSQDKITGIMIKEIELYPSYWYKSEARLLQLVERKYLPKKRNSMLDLGCGQGRLTLRFQEHFENITAIEPDQERIEIAKQNVLPVRKDVTFFQGVYQAYARQEAFDFILCSHVIQHIALDSVDGILRDIHNALKPGGTAILFTTHAKQKNTYHVKASIKNNQFHEEVITSDVFHEILHQKHMLPTTMFSFHDVKERIKKAGLGVKAYYVYHLDNKKVFHRCINDQTVNFFSCLKRKHGRDMMIVIEKQMKG